VTFAKSLSVVFLVFLLCWIPYAGEETSDLWEGDPIDFRLT